MALWAMTLLLLWLAVLVVLTMVMICAWAVQRHVRNAGWIDVFWTYGTGAAGVICALAAGGAPGRRVLVAVLVGAWSLRLGTYIARRVARSESEDVRYRRFRKEWGADYQARMARFVIVQGPIAAVMAAGPLLAAHAHAPFPNVADGLGVALYAGGLVIEALADWQMRRFRAASRGVCDRGLWRVSRHPNYVGEWVLWCAYPVIAIGAGGWPGMLALGAPATIFWLLVYVSGIPPLEREMLASRGDAYRIYQRRVAAFLPGFPSPTITDDQE